MTDPYLTLAEIEQRYPDEWVLLRDPRVDRRTQLTVGGYVLFHTPDRLVMDRRMFELGDNPPYRHFACVYTGEPVYPEVWERPEFLDDDDLRRAQ
jgi:hypothetical protein